MTPDSHQSEFVLIDVDRFKQAVWAVERESFRPGDALTALERATVRPDESNLPKINERWRYKPNRGAGAFTVVASGGDRVTLVGFAGKRKTISVKTLRGDYEPVPS